LREDQAALALMKSLPTKLAFESMGPSDRPRADWVVSRAFCRQLCHRLDLTHEADLATLEMVDLTINSR
jgi:hypothetical protein